MNSQSSNPVAGSRFFESLGVIAICTILICVLTDLLLCFQGHRVFGVRIDAVWVNPTAGLIFPVLTIIGIFWRLGYLKKRSDQ